VEAGADRQIIQSRVRVKSWVAKLPSTDDVRPARCPCCGVAARVVGESLGLWGHGTRERQVRGPDDAATEPQLRIVAVRRYRCRHCGATVTVAPHEVYHRRLYSVAAIGWALALAGLDRRPVAEIRRRVSPWKHVGRAAATRWLTLLRWVEAVTARRLFRRMHARIGRAKSWRCIAQRIAMALAGGAPRDQLDRPLSEQAFYGACAMA
jgi:hypothetical protein